jgi:hypothetical protein
MTASTASGHSIRQPPGMEPEIFAPGIVSSSEETEFGIAFTPDGKGVYFNRNGVVMVSTLSDTGWTAPVEAPFLKKYEGGAVHVLHDGNRLLMNRFHGPHNLKEGETDGIWALQKTEYGWDHAEFLIAWGMRATSTLDGSIHTTDISGGKENGDQGIIAKHVNSDSGYQRAADPDGGVNTTNSEGHPFIALDESYLIFDSTRPGGKGESDLYISHRNDNGSWSQAFNSELLNTTESEWCPTVSPDSKYLFFTRHSTGYGDIYWVDAKLIEGTKQ